MRPISSALSVVMVSLQWSRAEARAAARARAEALACATRGDYQSFPRGTYREVTVVVSPTTVAPDRVATARICWNEYAA